MQLTRARIIETAMELIEADGAENLSMARLAAELGCGLVALYSLMPSRLALLDGVAAAMFAAADVHPVAGAGWADQIRAQITAIRDAGRAHPRCALIGATAAAGSSAAAARLAERALAALESAGLCGQDAVRAMRALLAFCAGCLLPAADGLGRGRDWHDPVERGAPRLRAADYPRLTELASQIAASDPDADFEFGLSLLMDSISRLQDARAAA